MYIPKHYLATEEEEILDFIKTYSFGTIITSTENYPTATHLPFAFENTEEGFFIYSHFARANPQWKTITDNHVLIIFSEPHAYISPKYLDKKEEVPTWDYMSVHVYGTGKIVSEQSQAFSVLDKMIHTYEQEYQIQWDALSDEYKTKMLNGIVAFEIKVTDIQAKKKLNQKNNEAERQRIIQGLETSNSENEKTIAELMRKL